MQRGRYVPGTAGRGADPRPDLPTAPLVKVDGSGQAGGVRLLRTPQRTLVAALAGTLALVAAGCQVPGPDRTPTARASVALRQLDELPVAAHLATRGYSRSRFPHWRRIGANCDVRDAVLARDGFNVQTDGCNVVAGRWRSPYEDRWFDAPSMVDVDHLVPLANAWRSGAADWTDQVRGDFANDLVRPQLVTVSTSVNRAKGDQDPSRWRPADRDYWCAYAQSWVAVKHHWKLTVTAAEKAALEDMLETCPWPSSEKPTSSPGRAA